MSWCATKLNSRNIIFFYSRADPDALLLSHPYITGCGFAGINDSTDNVFDLIKAYFSRGVDLPNEPSLSLHFPRRQDIYNLGVLLMGIGTLGVLSHFTALAWNRLDPVELKSLFQEYEGELRDRMGNSYMRVTRWCLMPTEY